MSEQADVDVRVRTYDPEIDRETLWELKRGFELGIGEGTGGDEKGAIYEEKLTDRYRDRWLAWVDRCVEEDPGCIVVAETGSDSTAEIGGASDASTAAGGDTGVGDDSNSDDSVVGYAFVLPESLSFVWDAAVLNEIFVAPDDRGTGVSDALMDAAVECARSQELPLDRMVLDVDRENDRAQAFYERYGFEHWGEMVSREL